MDFVKCGFTNSKNRRYKCKYCSHVFSFKKSENSSKIYSSYIFEYNTFKILAKQDKITSRTIFNKIKSLPPKEPSPLALKSVVILADASYLGLKFGVLVFMDAIIHKCLWWKFLSSKEHVSDYKEGLEYCAKYYDIKAVVGDGILGLKKLCKEREIPFQICLVHVFRRAMTKLTKKPKSDAGKLLLDITKRLFDMSQIGLEYELKRFAKKFESFLNERTYSLDGSWRYTHGNVRGAHFTLKSNLEYLYTYKIIQNMPRGNNIIESFFRDLKAHMSIHKGLKIQNKRRFISWYIYLKNQYYYG